MKCEIPSFVADFVSVTHWLDSSGKEYYPNKDYGTNTYAYIKVVNAVSACEVPI